MDKSILKVTNVSKHYKNTKALDGVTMKIERGEIYGLIGRNGAGKTTLFRIISGLIFPTTGEVSLFTKSSLNSLGVLIENPGLYPNLNAYDNLQLKCVAYGVDSKDYINELLAMVGLIL